MQVNDDTSAIDSSRARPEHPATRAQVRKKAHVRKTLTAAAAVTSVLLIAACSSSSTSSSSAASGSSASASASASTSSGSSSDSAGVAAAKAFEAQYLNSPTSINLSSSLTSKPAAKKLVVGLQYGVPGAAVLAQYWAKAAAAIGWTYKNLNAGITPSSQQAAMDTAIQLDPAGIFTTGIANSTLKAQLILAKQKGIWVNASGTTDPPSGAMYDTSIANNVQGTLWGKMVAAYVVVQSNGKAVIQQFTLPTAILQSFDTAFDAAIKQWCPACKVTLNPQQPTSLGTTTPTAVVSAITRDPSTNWLIFDLGDLATGVNAALSAAGLHGLHIGGLSADAPNIQALKDKTQDVWTGYSTPIIAYRQIDSLARKLMGMPVADAPLPTQLITQQNVGSLVEDAQGNYVGVASYSSQFLKSWQASSS